MTLIEKLEKRKRGLEQRNHTLQNWRGRLHPIDQAELARNTEEIERITEALSKLKAVEVGNDNQEVR